jgi:hypothetical protein
MLVASGAACRYASGGNVPRDKRLRTTPRCYAQYVGGISNGMPLCVGGNSVYHAAFLQLFAVMLNHIAWVGVQMLSFRRSIQEDDGFH